MTVEIQALMDHTGWVQELAHKLVGDPNLADDLAQETMLAALRGGASPVRSSKAWLGAVLKNLLWQRVRGERRRRSRELRASREERVPSSAQLVERMSAHREVVNVVMSLPEHYRIVLLRRYFEGETPTVIAARTGIPISTVKTRLGRALDLMRQRLDAAHGEDGRGWIAALVPLLGDRTVGPPPVPLRALVVGTSCVIMAAAVVLAWPGLVGSSPAGLASGPAAASVQTMRAAGDDAALATAGSSRTAIEVTSEVLGTNLADLMAAPGPLHGRVFDAQGGALAGPCQAGRAKAPRSGSLRPVAGSRFPAPWVPGW
jgi:RNA polymerase sigma-70 factor (ECF subfamily)